MTAPTVFFRSTKQEFYCTSSLDQLKELWKKCVGGIELLNLQSMPADGGIPFGSSFQYYGINVFI